ncbi:hypothetical protein [Devosia sp.]|uniref:hypothetical protein n=1 Tax=Devosia sp. TaxID=1871048 RepID=UPI002736F25A|nr:hypothetical protein [Devosia sp.]MDP2782262.1 hypothetical protein [Devosia sp.]
MDKSYLESQIMTRRPGASSIHEVLMDIGDEGKMGVSRLPDGNFHAIMPCPAVCVEDESHGFGGTREMAMLHCAFEAMSRRDAVRAMSEEVSMVVPMALAA